MPGVRHGMHAPAAAPARPAGPTPPRYATRAATKCHYTGSRRRFRLCEGPSRPVEWLPWAAACALVSCTRTVMRRRYRYCVTPPSSDCGVQPPAPGVTRSDPVASAEGGREGTVWNCLAGRRAFFFFII